MKSGKMAGEIKGCVYCGSKGNRNAFLIGRYGKDQSKKLLKCRHCGRKYSETHGTLFKGSRLSPSQYRQILKLMFNGVSIRDTATDMKMAPDTVFRARKKLESHIDHELLSMFRDLGFTKILRKGLSEYLTEK
jgi:transposase-like protein